MKNQKVAIIGAGICGLYLSQKLSEKGFKVTVFEKKKKIGKHACSGLFSQKILNFIPESKRIIQNRIKYALLHFPKKTIRLDFTEDFLVMEHYKLDKLVARLLDKEKVNIVLDKRIDSLPEDFDRIIGCDGAHSQTRKLLGIKDCDYQIGIQGFVDKEDFSDFVEVWPTKEGFVWKIPRGARIEYGIIENTKNAKMLLDQFLEKNDIQLEEIISAFIPQGLRVSFNDKITLCGDAAGLTKPWSGGGVIWGLVAADFLLKNFPNLVKYKVDLERFFLPRIFLSRIATKIVYFVGFRFSFLIPKRIKVENDFLI